MSKRVNSLLYSALSNLMASNHEKSGGYVNWNKVTEYYSFYYAEAGLLRLAGYANTTAYLIEEDKPSEIWLWRTATNIPEYQIGKWPKLKDACGITARDPLSGVHGKVAQVFAHLFRNWRDGPPCFNVEVDSTIKLLRTNPPFPYEYPIELRIDHNYTPRHLVHELASANATDETRNLSVLGPREWEDDPEEWWFALTVWQMIGYGLNALCQAGQERQLELITRLVTEHSVSQPFRSEVMGFVMDLQERYRTS